MALPPYYQQVYEVTQSIPEGRVTTYGLIADYLSLGSARMVGWALKQSLRLGETALPAHRVVNSKGELSGRAAFATPTLMAELLVSEGVEVVDNRVQDFQARLWMPSEMY